MTVTILLSITVTLPPLLTGALAVHVGESLSLSSVRLGVSISAFFLATAASSVFLGRAADLLGWRTSVGVAACVSGAALIGMSTAARGFLTLTGLLAVAGVANALAIPSINVGLAPWMSTRATGLLIGITQAAIPTTGVLAGLAVPSVAAHLGWRETYAIAAVTPLAVLAVLPLLRPLPRVQAAPTATARSKSRALIWITISGGLGTVAFTALASFYVVTTVESGISNGKAGLMLALGGLVGAAIRVATGAYISRGQRAPDLRSVAVLQFAASLGLSLLATQQREVIVPATLLAFAGAWGWTTSYQHALVVYHQDRPGAATGIALTGMAVGAMVGPLLFGLLHEVASTTVAWSTIAGLSALSAATVLLGARAYSRERRQPVPG
jgi:MFS family permease